MIHDTHHWGAWLRLSLTPGVGPESARRLLAAFGEPQAIFAQTEAALGQVVNAAIAGRERMEGMKAFFEGVGKGDTAGIWEGAPNLRPDFRALHQKKLEKAAKAAKAEEMI